ncbi:C40 family peptidase [Aeromonas sp. RU39B]|jgi:cell wall-associated NlpC family hydrolase|uniref:C40 family peptidase n=1 Tax=Aeromonas sp. RU39B TaxID=1907416 RepID=UPI00211672F4|nr:NlpC/P60 family protein [Aeromonas sp. RU39B]
MFLGGKGLRYLLLLLVALGMAGCSSTPDPEVASKLEVSMVEPVVEPESSAPSVEDIISVYKQWKGVPYRMGGTSQRGVDCSAFAREVFRDALGIELPRSTRSQVQEGTRVAKNDLVEGDLVFFRINRRLNHVGIYIGNGEFIHASTTKGVTRSRLDDSYWRGKFWQARRVNI